MLQAGADRNQTEGGEEVPNPNWDPVKIGLGYLDLTPYCDMPAQIAGSFLQAGFWFFKAMRNLGDDTGAADNWA